MSQVEYLLVLCCGFLAAVIIAGILKMRLNTAKGVTAERLLRRLRYSLISRMVRFPTPYFRTTSQGELVSMITSESEPMGGLMGDALAQPVFQAGQMATIVVFLFMQSVWFGLPDQPAEQGSYSGSPRPCCRNWRDRCRDVRPAWQWRLALPFGASFGPLGAAV